MKTVEIRKYVGADLKTSKLEPEIVELPFDDTEQNGLLASADLLKRTLSTLKK